MSGIRSERCTRWLRTSWWSEEILFPMQEKWVLYGSLGSCHRSCLTHEALIRNVLTCLLTEEWSLMENLRKFSITFETFNLFRNFCIPQTQVKFPMVVSRVVPSRVLNFSLFIGSKSIDHHSDRKGDLVTAHLTHSRYVTPSPPLHFSSLIKPILVVGLYPSSVVKWSWLTTVGVWVGRRVYSK